MSIAKTILLAIYALLAFLAISMQDSPAGQVASWVLVALACAHLIEVVVFFRLCKQAGGSLAMHLVNVFLFGVLHVKQIKAGQA